MANGIDKNALGRGGIGDRRRFLVGAGASMVLGPVVLGGCANLARTSQDMHSGQDVRLGISAPNLAPKPDYHMQLAMSKIDIADDHTVETLTVNDMVPGPLLRFKEGKRTTVQVTNNTHRDEVIHWHGLFLPSDVDGAPQQGSPMIPPGGSLSYTFIPEPSGTRWYHSHAGSDGDFRQGTYSGLNGIVYIEPKNDPGRYDREVFLAIHSWGTEIIANKTVDHATTFNGRKLGHGEPIRVREGERVMFRILNSGPSMGRRISLSGHVFKVVAMDGNPVPDPIMLERINLAPGERIDALVEMNNPGKWIFGDYVKAHRDQGAGIIVEYANATGEALWVPPADTQWNLCDFTKGTTRFTPDHIYDMHFAEIQAPDGQLNRWTINGRSFPDMDNFMLEEGKRYRLIFHNPTSDIHPMHIHRHTFEVTHYMGQYTSGLMKDVVSIVPNQSVSVDFMADAPGLTLFHCHMTSHMENGFMALFEYKT